MSPRKRRINFGRWQLERERSQLPDDTLPPRNNSAVTAGDVAEVLLKRLGLNERLWEQSLLEEWVALVGETVARRARPGSIQRKVLTVYVNNATWLNELARYGKTDLLQKLQSRFGADHIADLRFQPDPDLQPPRNR
ncbi:MAG: DUF721 domain-containing protein [Kiritimatiellae bacterium]|nr:DUF721 domain-containing protein [Kiritimatiellia bacterium]